MTAPDLDSGVVIPYDVMGEISYGYSTTGVTQIEVMGQERWGSNQPTRSTPSVDNSGGPIQLSVNTKTPIILYGGSDRTTQLCLNIENAGDGEAYLPSESEPDNKVRISSSSQSSEVQLTSLDTGGTGGDGVVSMNDNGAGTTCYQVEASGNNPNLKTTVPVTFTAEYNYRKEVTTSVTVEGR
jgi:hypothetical protein